MKKRFEVNLGFDVEAMVEHDGVNEEDIKRFQTYLEEELSWYVSHHMGDIVERFYDDKERGAI